MPLIKIVSSGGTIVNTRQGLTGVEKLLTDIPEARTLADFDITDPVRVRSGSLRPK